MSHDDLLRDSPSGEIKGVSGGVPTDIQFIARTGAESSAATQTFANMASGAVAPFPTIMQTTHLDVNPAFGILVWVHVTATSTGGPGNGGATQPGYAIRIVTSINGGPEVVLTESTQEVVWDVNAGIATIPVCLLTSIELDEPIQSIDIRLQWRRLTGALGSASIDTDNANGQQAQLFSALVENLPVRPPTVPS